MQDDQRVEMAAVQSRDQLDRGNVAPAHIVADKGKADCCRFAFQYVISLMANCGGSPILGFLATRIPACIAAKLRAGRRRVPISHSVTAEKSGETKGLTATEGILALIRPDICRACSNRQLRSTQSGSLGKLPVLASNSSSGAITCSVSPGLIIAWSSTTNCSDRPSCWRVT